MLIETIQTDELSQFNRLINEAVEQRKIIDIKLTVTPYAEKILYTALIMIEE